MYIELQIIQYGQYEYKDEDYTGQATDTIDLTQLNILEDDSTGRKELIKDLESIEIIENFNTVEGNYTRNKGTISLKPDKICIVTKNGSYNNDYTELIKQ